MNPRKLLPRNLSFEHFVEAANIAFLLIAPDSMAIRFINQRCARLIGLQSSEATDGTASFLDLMHPDDREYHSAIHSRLVGGEIDNHYSDQRIVVSRGRVLWMHVVRTVIRDEEGRARFIGVSIQDISDRLVVENEVVSLGDLQQLMVWKWSVKPSGAAVNIRIQFKFGAAEYEGEAFAALLRTVHSDDRATVEKDIRRALANGAAFSHEYRMIMPDNQCRWLRVMVIPLLDPLGRVTHLTGSVADVTHTRVRGMLEQVPERIADILNYIEQNWNKPIYLNELASRYGVSARAVQRYFAAKQLMTLTQYVSELRLRHARDWLTSPTHGTTVTGVAYYCGFLNPGNFSRDYRRRFGELPSETLRVARSSRKRR